VTTFAYTSGDPSHLTAGTNATMADIQGPFVDLRTFVNGNISDINLTSSAAINENKLAVGSSGLAKGAFRAYRNAAYSVVTNTNLVFDTDSGVGFDVSGWFDTTTGRYTPQVAGYYQLSWAVGTPAGTGTDLTLITTLRKSGTPEVVGGTAVQRSASAPTVSSGSTVVIANGTTDYFEVNLQHTLGASATLQVGTTPQYTYFCGQLIGRS